MKIILEEISNEIFVEIIDKKNNYKIEKLNINDLPNPKLIDITQSVFLWIAKIGEKLHELSKR